jgi:hypothetical protein
MKRKHPTSSAACIMAYDGIVNNVLLLLVLGYLDTRDLMPFFLTCTLWGAETLVRQAGHRLLGERFFTSLCEECGQTDVKTLLISHLEGRGVPYLPNLPMCRLSDTNYLLFTLDVWYKQKPERFVVTPISTGPGKFRLDFQDNEMGMIDHTGKLHVQFDESPKVTKSPWTFKLYVSTIDQRRTRLLVESHEPYGDDCTENTVAYEIITFRYASSEVEGCMYFDRNLHDPTDQSPVVSIREVLLILNVTNTPACEAAAGDDATDEDSDDDDMCRKNPQFIAMCDGIASGEYERLRIDMEHANLSDYDEASTEDE